MDVSCHMPFLPGTSLEPKVISTAQVSRFTLQYFPYYVWCFKHSCLLLWIYRMFSCYSFQIFPYASRYYSSGSNYYWYNLYSRFQIWSISTNNSCILNSFQFPFLIIIIIIIIIAVARLCSRVNFPHQAGASSLSKLHDHNQTRHNR